MLDIKKQFIVKEKNQKVAVQIDIDRKPKASVNEVNIFEKIEDLLENYVLTQKMKEVAEDESLDLQAAKVYYPKLLDGE